MAEGLQALVFTKLSSLGPRHVLREAGWKIG